MLRINPRKNKIFVIENNKKISVINIKLEQVKHLRNLRIIVICTDVKAENSSFKKIILKLM